MDESSKPTDLSHRQKIGIFILKYGYANYILGSWGNAIIAMGKDNGRSSPGIVWDAIGMRAQARLTKNGFKREDY